MTTISGTLGTSSSLSHLSSTGLPQPMVPGLSGVWETECPGAGIFFPICRKNSALSCWITLRATLPDHGCCGCLHSGDQRPRLGGLCELAQAQVAGERRRLPHVDGRVGPGQGACPSGSLDPRTSTCRRTGGCGARQNAGHSRKAGRLQHGRFPRMLPPRALPALLFVLRPLGLNRQGQV